MRRRPVRVVVATALVVAAVASVAAATGPLRTGPVPIVALVVAWAAIGAWVVVFVGGIVRRRREGTREWRLGELIALAAATVVVAAALDFHPALIWMPFFLVLAAGRSLAPLPAVAICALPVAYLGMESWRESGSPVSAAANVVAAAGMLAYSLQRRRRRELDELAAAQREVIEQEQARADAAVLQREIGARLHDVLAHTLSGLVVSLTTASLQARAEGASPQLQERLDASTDLARSGLVEARRAVESLRGGPVADRSTPAPAPGPRSASGESAPADDAPLTAWFAEVGERLQRAAGTQVRLDGDLTLVPGELAGVARAVLLESLTNSLRHSPGAPIDVRVRAGGLTVVSAAGERVAAPDSGEHPSGHHGIDGLRARVEAAGGHLVAGPEPAGWTVRWEWSR